MPRNSNSVVISAPAEEVIGYAACFENDPRWNSEVESMRYSSERPVGVGTRAVEHARVRGQTMQTTTVISEYESNRRVAAKSVSVAVSRDFEPVPGGTRMAHTLDGDIGGVLLFRLMGPLLTRWYGGRFMSHLQTPKEIPKTKPPASGEGR